MRTSTPVPDRWDGHLLLLPLSRAADRAGVAAWAQRGLDQGEKLIYAADAENSTTGSLVGSLAKHGVDAAEAATIGQLVVVDSGQFYSVDAHDRLVAEAFARGYPGVRTCGGSDAAAGILSEEQLARFEHMLEQMWAIRQVSAMCRYAARTTTGPSLDCAATRHPSAAGDQQIHAHSPEPGQLYLDGEVDAANNTLLAAVCHGRRRARRTHAVP